MKSRVVVQIGGALDGYHQAHAVVDIPRVDDQRLIEEMEADA